jgi:hypothetical protein
VVPWSVYSTENFNDDSLTDTRRELARRINQNYEEEQKQNESYHNWGNTQRTKKEGEKP